MTQSFPHGSRVSRRAVFDKASLSVARFNPALVGLDASGHVWQEGDMLMLSSFGTTFDT